MTDTPFKIAVGFALYSIIILQVMSCSDSQRTDRAIDDIRMRVAEIQGQTKP